MQKGNIISLLIILISKISLITSTKYRFENKDNEKIEYIFSEFSNFDCNSNYTTIFTSKICSYIIINKVQNFSFSLKDTNSESHKIKCIIEPNSKMRYLQGDDDEDNTDIELNDYCYNTNCQFEDMVKENITIFINKDVQTNVEGLSDDVYLTTYLNENFTLKVNKCYLVKNVFKQVYLQLKPL